MLYPFQKARNIRGVMLYILFSAATNRRRGAMFNMPGGHADSFIQVLIVGKDIKYL
jgi:hypothetical protein